jgi:hypothetical protein
MMKPLALIFAVVPFLALPAFADVAVLSGSGGGIFETTFCLNGTCTDNVDGIFEEVDVDNQGNVTNVTDEFNSLSGPFTWVLDAGQATLPAGSIVTGATFKVTLENSTFGTAGFVLTGDSTLTSSNVGISCDGSSPTFFNFPSAPAHTVTGSFTPCSGQNIQSEAFVSGTASLSGTVSPFPTTPGANYYFGYLNQNINYTVDLDYTVPGEAPEPAELLPLTLAAGFLVVLARTKIRRNGPRCGPSSFSRVL